MGQDKARAQQLALKWWKNSGHSGAVCDKCNGDIPEGGGYLCKPALVGFNIGGQMMDMSGSPDLLCERCFDGSTSARPFEGRIPASKSAKKWWQFWR